MKQVVFFLAGFCAALILSLAFAPSWQIDRYHIYEYKLPEWSEPRYYAIDRGNGFLKWHEHGEYCRRECDVLIEGHGVYTVQNQFLTSKDSAEKLVELEKRWRQGKPQNKFFRYVYFVYLSDLNLIE